VALRIRPILSKDFNKEIILHAEYKNSESKQKDIELSSNNNPTSIVSDADIEKPQILRLTDMTHHMRVEYHRVFP
jgi:hypothetical protein